MTCLYFGTTSHAGAEAGDLWARLAALAINSHFLPNAVFASALGLAQPCFGATIALRRSVLRRIGGLAAFKDALADDYAIGQAIRAHGYRVVIPGFAVGHVCQEISLGALLSHELRVARTIRSVAPVGHWGLALSHPFALAILAMPFSPGSAAMLASVALACRAAVYLAVKHTFKFRTQSFWLIPLHDLLAFPVFLCSLVGHSVRWQGAGYQIGNNGKFMPDRRSA